ncbi:transglycosylase SLT domain-containing protein, partial [Candidatus Kaiserbacteria bacterium]|nr:transglycosylase SLT domain-containing protein [Candidatus Kaiserbacteria bacterium]
MAHLASLQLSTLLCLFLLSAGAGANAVWQNGLEQLIQRCTPYYETFLAAGRSEDLAPHLLMAIAARESACEADAVSAEAADTGEHAYGLMQILP